jgi:hypothetical protein
MRKLLLGLTLALVTMESAKAACGDTTVNIASSPAGVWDNGTKIYTPTTLNAAIAGCTDAIMTIHLKYAGDTIKLANEITIASRNGKTTRIIGEGTGDSILTLLESNPADPQLILANTGNKTILTNLGFARKSIGASSPTGSSVASVVLNADSSSVSGCHFWALDNTTEGLCPLLLITANGVLVQQSLFRAPPDGLGRAVAIHTSGGASRVEIRSNVFHSTGLQLASTGFIHVLANTFSGSRDKYNAIIVGASIGTSPDKNINIQHNLFANKVDIIPPIQFAGGIQASDSILRNAWSRGAANLPLAVSALTGSASITLNGNSGINVNTPLPRGFSNYGPSSTNVKDYPLTQLRTDATLARKHGDFGKIFRVFTNSSWSAMSDIKDFGASKTYFQDFTPFIAGRLWASGVKVGALVDVDVFVDPPSPLDSGAQGASLKFAPVKNDSVRIVLTQRSYDANYYKSTILPGYIWYFFSDTLSKLTASNDTTALLNSVKATSSFKRFTTAPEDTTFLVPKEVRLGSDIPFYVKMLHYRNGYQAPVQSSAVIATVRGVPSFPINDLTVKLDSGLSRFPDGQATLIVTRKTEDIDSVRIVVATEGGQLVKSVSKPAGASNSNLTFDITVTKGTFVFSAVPIAKLPSGQVKEGSATKSTAPATFITSSSDTIFVQYKSTACPGADGTLSNPFCGLDSAMKEVSVRKGGTVIIKNGNPVIAMEDITIAPLSVTDTDPVTIMTTPLKDKYDENRPIFRGKTKEALTITRKNVTLKGFFIEMPVGSANTALSVKGSGALVEGNIFRAQAKGAVEGAAVNIDVGATAEMRFVNNLVWGFTKNVQITTPASAKVRVVNNTFVDDAGLSNTGKTFGILSGTGAMSAVFANNFFSGIVTPVDSSAMGKTPPPVFDHNAYTGKPDIGYNDIGALDPAGRIQSTDIWVSNYTIALETFLIGAIECGISPCGPLYAGSSTANYDVTVNRDVLGRPRTNKKEVGAYEFGATSQVLGALSLALTTVTEDYTRINWVVTAKNFDPSEADTLYVFWSATDISTNLENAFGNLPGVNIQHIAISELNAGNVTGFFTNIKEEATRHFFYAALGHTDPVSKKRTLGYGYGNSIMSLIKSEPGDCNIEGTTFACPSGTGLFTVGTGIWAGQFRTRVNFSEAVSTGTVKNPEFISIQNSKVFNLDLTSPLPMIVLTTSIPGLGDADSKQSIKADIEMNSMPDLTGFDLFLIPSDSNGMASFVPTWSYKQVDGKTNIVIEGNTSGKQNYAFGKLQATLEPGVIAASNEGVPVYDFTAHRDSAVMHVPLKFKGTGFKTANPLVLVSIVPAGGIIRARDGKIVDVLSGSYHTRTLAFSSGFSKLPESLKTDRFYRYLRKAAAYEGVSSMAMGHNKPFLLDTNIDLANFGTAASIQSADIAVAAGAMGEVAVDLAIARNFKDFANYPDEKAKASRSIEVVYTVFDGSRISRSRSFIRTRFSDAGLDLHVSERLLNGFESSRPGTPKWNLFGYPWDESGSGTLAKVVGKTKWDNDNMRLMKYKGTGSGAGSFNIYNGSNPGDLRYDSGQAVWSGSTGAYQPLCDTGMSLDFETFKMPLTPNQWNDVALPFNFDIKWVDILDSSKIDRKSAPPAWKYVAAQRAFEPLTAGSASPPIAGSILKPWEGYTMRPTSPVTLMIPVLDTMRSTTALAKAAAKPAANDPSWTARVLASNGTASMYLRIGKGDLESVFPESPDVPGQDFRLALKHSRPAGDEKVSEYIQALDGDWQGHWPLQASIGQGAGGVSLRVGDASRSVPIYLVETLHKTALPLSADAPISVSEAELRANDYHLVAGDMDYVNAVMQGLQPQHLLALTNAPNPFAGATLIRYALPESFGKVSFDLKVRDFRGRTVWQRTIRGGNSLSYLWDGRDRMNSPLPAGVYQLTLEASAPGKPVFKANRRMLRM